MPESRQSNTSSINQLQRDVHVVNVEGARTIDWQQALYFFSSPRPAMQASEAFPFGPWSQIRHPSELTERDWENALRERQGGNGGHTRKFIFLSTCRTEKWHKGGQNNSFQRTFQLPIFKGRRIISMVSIRRHNTSWKHSLLFDELSHRQCAGVQASWIQRVNVTKWKICEG